VWRGDPIHPQVEEYRGSVNPIGIWSCYDEGAGLLKLFFDYHRQNDVDIRVARIKYTSLGMLENVMVG